MAKWGKIANAPSESGVASYGQHERTRPIPHFIGGLLKRWNNWCQAGRKRHAKFRQRALVPGETTERQLAPKADEYLRAQVNNVSNLHTAFTLHSFICPLQYNADLTS